MPLTITAFTNFVPETVAKSSEVNNNFGNFRGTLIPIETNTATASDNTHDKGSPTYRYKDSYNAGFYYIGVANAAGGWRIGIGDTTTSLVFERFSSTAYVTKGEFSS